MFCSNCGKPVDDGAGFCPSCGTAIEPDEVMEVINDVQAASEVPVMPTPQPEVQTAQPIQQQQTVQQAQVVQSVQQVQQPQGSYCAGCGAFVEAGQQFCPKCGTAKGGVKKAKADNEIVKLAQTMIKTPVDGFAALYQSKDTKLPAIFVAVQAVLAIVYGLLLDNKLVNAYNEYVTNLAVNLSNSLTSMASDLVGGLGATAGSLAGGVVTSAINELIEELFGELGATVGTTLQMNSSLIGIGAILIASIVAIAAQILLLFLLMQIFKIKSVFMDAVKIYAAKSYWSVLCILIAMVLILISPVAAIGFVLVGGIFVNHSIGQMLLVHSPQSKNQVFWIQLIFNIIEVATVALSIYYVSGVIGDNLINYVSGIVGGLAGYMGLF